LINTNILDIVKSGGNEHGAAEDYFRLRHPFEDIEMEESL
jgi:hypothetical protein